MKEIKNCQSERGYPLPFAFVAYVLTTLFLYYEFDLTWQTFAKMKFFADMDSPFFYSSIFLSMFA